MIPEVEALVREALDASDVAYWSYSISEQIAYFSDQFYLMLGYEAGAFPMTMESWLTLLHPDEAESVVSTLAKLAETERDSFQTEYRLKTAAGGWKWVQVRAKVVERGENGKPLRVSGTNIEITRQKLLEEAFLESEARWNSLVNEAPLGILLVNREGQVQFANQFETEAHDGLGVGRNWKDFFPQDLRPQIEDALEWGFVQGLPRTLETYSIGSHTALTYYENHISPLRQDGKVTALLVVSLNTTAQSRTRKRQAKAAQRMGVLLGLNNEHHTDDRKLLATAIDGAIDLTDSELGLFFLYSKPQDQLSLHVWAKAGLDGTSEPPPRPVPVGKKAGLVGQVFGSRKPLVINDFETPPHLFDGKNPFSDSIRRALIFPVMEDQTLGGLFVLANKYLPYDEDDVEEIRTFSVGIWQVYRQMQVEETLRRLYQAVEHSPVSIVMTTPDGMVTYANPRFAVSLELPMDQITGRPHPLLNAAILGEAEYENLVHMVSGGREWTGRISSKRKDGTVLKEWITISPVRNAREEISHYLIVEEDVTEREATQEMLSRAQRMETVGQLAAGVAHDFNNLLTSVLNYNQMLLRKIPPGDPLRVFAEKIDLSGKRASDLVSGLLAVGRQQRLTKVKTDLTQLLTDLLPLLDSLTKGQVRFENQEARPLMVEVDPGQINQVVTNLVSNAKDAAPSSPIVISCGRGTSDRGPQAWFRVQDRGPGIPEDLLEKVFEPFFTTKDIGKGTGLGLSIVHGIVQQHQGTIAVESHLGLGTTFTVSIPLSESAPDTASG